MAWMGVEHLQCISFKAESPCLPDISMGLGQNLFKSYLLLSGIFKCSILVTLQGPKLLEFLFVLTSLYYSILSLSSQHTYPLHKYREEQFNTRYHFASSLAVCSLSVVLSQLTVSHDISAPHNNMGLNLSSSLPPFLRPFLSSSLFFFFFFFPFFSLSCSPLS